MSQRQKTLPKSEVWEQSADCGVCERHVYAQVFFRPSHADEEFTEICDKETTEYLTKVFDLNKIDFKVPLIFGSLINDWKSVQPMLYMNNYGLNYVIPKTKPNPD